MYLKINPSVKRLHESDIGVTRSGSWSPDRGWIYYNDVLMIIFLVLWKKILWLLNATMMEFTEKVILIYSNSSCESNCGTYLNPSRRIILTTTCLHCDGTNQINYNWSAEDVKASASFPIWPDRALTPRDSQNAVILGNTFDSGASYKIRVMASRSNSG